ncbi:unnamed protein product, partial [marine sediment metagenome]
MRQTFSLFLFLCFCTFSLFAQQSFPGAIKVRYEEKETFPRYIQFDQSQQLSVEKSLTWMRENFRLDES